MPCPSTASRAGVREQRPTPQGNWRVLHDRLPHAFTCAHHLTTCDMQVAALTLKGDHSVSQSGFVSLFSVANCISRLLAGCAKRLSSVVGNSVRKISHQHTIAVFELPTRNNICRTCHVHLGPIGFLDGCLVHCARCRRAVFSTRRRVSLDASELEVSRQSRLEDGMSLFPAGSYRTG